MDDFQKRAYDESQKGQKLNTPLVTDYMTPVGKLITIKGTAPVTEALNILLDKHITGAPVVNNEGEVVGLIDDKDCLNILLGGAYYNEPMVRNTVSDYMSNVMKSISTHLDIVEVAHIFLTTPYKRLLVMDDNGQLAGQISRRDVLRAIRDMKPNIS